MPIISITSIIQSMYYLYFRVEQHRRDSIIAWPFKVFVKEVNIHPIPNQGKASQ